LDEITPEAPPPSLPFRRPADYYSSPVGDARPLFPRWVPYGCGVAAIFVLIVVFGLGLVAARGGIGPLFELMFATMEGEIDKMFTPDVTPNEKAVFGEEMKKMRELVRQNRVPVDRLQPLLRTLREATSDQRVTAAETEQLIRGIRDVNSSVKH